MGNRLRCYFAHHVPDYGTQREADAIATISAAGFEVDNPNQPEHDAGYRAHGMDYFLGRVATCDALAFQRFSTGEIGAGVGKEIGKAVELRMPVYEVVEDILNPIDGGAVIDDVLSIDETRAMIQLLRSVNQA